MKSAKGKYLDFSQDETESVYSIIFLFNRGKRSWFKDWSQTASTLLWTIRRIKEVRYSIFLNIQHSCLSWFYFRSADETVKKIFSLEYAHRVSWKKYLAVQKWNVINILFKKLDYKRYEEEMIKKVFQRIPIEEDSLEIQSKKYCIYWQYVCFKTLIH
jgi:hypothetical protein